MTIIQRSKRLEKSNCLLPRRFFATKVSIVKKIVKNGTAFGNEPRLCKQRMNGAIVSEKQYFQRKFYARILLATLSKN